jgi:phosphoglycerate dehydrogenase-like enzyme
MAGPKLTLPTPMITIFLRIVAHSHAECTLAPMNRTTVLYLCPLGKQHQEWRLAAAPPGIDVIMRRSTETSREEVLALLANADALITERVGAVDRAMIEAAPRLKVIQRLGSLYHDIDLDAAREFNVPVCVQPIRGTIAVAENMMLQVLAVLRRAMPLQKTIHMPPEEFRMSAPADPKDVPREVPFTPRRTSEDVFAFNWSRQARVRLVYRKTIGILGFGEIGAELARRLQNWDCRVLYSKRSPLPRFIEDDLRIEHRGQQELLRESDVVICLLPYFRETDQWLNAERIAMMKPGAYLCEAGSGSVVDEQAVADAVRRGHLAGASFDTYEWEPIKPDNPLLQLADSDPDANIFLLPHIGSCGDVSTSEFNEFYGNALSVLTGGPVTGRVA